MAQHQQHQQHSSQTQQQQQPHRMQTTSDTEKPKRVYSEVDIRRYRKVTIEEGGAIRFACSLCGNTFKWRKTINEHWKRHHIDEQPPPLDAPVIVKLQNSSTNKNCSREVDPARYRKVLENGDIRFACSLCGNTFKWRKTINEHWKRNHIAEVPPPLDAPVMAKMRTGIVSSSCVTASAAGGSSAHAHAVDPARYRKVSEEGVSKFACSLCGNTFLKRASVNRHWKRNHINEQPPPLDAPVVVKLKTSINCLVSLPSSLSSSSNSSSSTTSNSSSSTTNANIFSQMQFNSAILSMPTHFSSSSSGSSMLSSSPSSVNLANATHAPSAYWSSFPFNNFTGQHQNQHNFQSQNNMNQLISFKPVPTTTGTVVMTGPAAANKRLKINNNALSALGENNNDVAGATLTAATAAVSSLNFEMPLNAATSMACNNQRFQRKQATSVISDKRR
jgi:predicted RNA-binding Zn-ribbon protein involved in translation (DUF1610 family)